MREHEFLPPDEYRCLACGHMKDTPAHELGCPVGRGLTPEPRPEKGMIPLGRTLEELRANEADQAE